MFYTGFRYVSFFWNGNGRVQKYTLGLGYRTAPRFPHNSLPATFDVTAPCFFFFPFPFFLFFFRFSKRRSSLLAFYSWNVCPLLFRNRAWFTVSPLLATRLFLSLRYEQRFRQRRVGLGTSQRSSGARKRVQREKKILEPANLCGRWGKKYRDTKQDRSVLSRAESFVDTNRVSRDKPVSFQPAPPLPSSESRKTILRPNFSSRLEDIQFYRVINSIVNS